jgi:uncharacterized protein (DUF305 family)
MRYRKVAGALLAVACLFGATTASVAASSAATQTSAAAMQMSPNQADVEFVSMMIPHHYQALVMSQMAPSRSNNDELLALASRIDVEQSGEISTMQNWQAWNGLEVTNAEEAYHHLLMHHPEHAEEMGMATPEELAQLSAASGPAFDVLFLQLMIEHHEGALDMIVDVLTNGSDFIVQWMATEMGATQDAQIEQMEGMLADLT